jgi:hypothetical protein
MAFVKQSSSPSSIRATTESRIVSHLVRSTARVSGELLVVGGGRAGGKSAPLVDSVEYMMASIKVKGRVPVFCSWDSDFMVAVVVLGMCFGSCEAN